MNKLYKILKYTKYAIYVIVAIVNFIFREQATENVRFVVGGIMLLYSIIDIDAHFVEKRKYKENPRIFNDIITIAFGLLLLLKIDTYAYVCIIWAAWTITREGNEIVEVIKEREEENSKKIFLYLDLAESLVSIAFSFLLIMNPHPEHAKIHVIYLSFELLSEVLFPFLENNDKTNKDEEKDLNN